MNAIPQTTNRLFSFCFESVLQGARRIPRWCYFGLAMGVLLGGMGRAAAADAPKAGVATPATPGLGLKEGDRVIFIGDSITHQCLYTRYIEDFYYTRYPNMRMHFRNAGVSGDCAADVLDRFDEDIAAFKPTLATVLLGMNDAGYKDFDRATFATYERDMNRLLDRLDTLKCKVILLSPTMFDHRAFAQAVAKNPARGKNISPENYNAVLAYYGKWCQEAALKRGLQFVDFFSELNAFTVQQRKADPDFTFSPDAVHPGPDGQLVMAYTLLKQTGELGGILSTGVRLAGGRWQPLSGQVMRVQGEPGKNASYMLQPRALPWTEGAEAPIGYKITRAGHTGSQESHIVVGLQAGRYDLRINGQTVGNFDERMLAVHAEIQEDTDSPTFQQAMQVVALNKKRNVEAIDPLRDMYAQRKVRLRAAKDRPDMKKDFETWMTSFREKQAELEKKATAIEDEIYQANQVKPLQVEIQPADAKAAKAGA